jgi:hypothetical protein
MEIQLDTTGNMQYNAFTHSNGGFNMQYKLRCNSCDHTFVAQYKSACCPRRCHGSSSVSFIEDVLDVAVDVATAYVMADVTTDIISGVAGLIGGLFD